MKRETPEERVVRLYAELEVATRERDDANRPLMARIEGLDPEKLMQLRNLINEKLLKWHDDWM